MVSTPVESLARVTAFQHDQRARARIALEIALSGRISSTPPSLIASWGIPKTTDVASSWAM